MTKEQIRDWLLKYAWSGTPEAQAEEVACIMAQDDWKYIDAQTEKLAGQAWDDAMAAEAEGYALSALYECHGGPHLATCPDQSVPG
jgi:hypothetical protein